jgi:hypothetical protein
METIALLEMSCGLQLQEVARQQLPAEESWYAPRARVQSATPTQKAPLATLVILHGYAITVASELQP